jgi:hypothetical protein
VRPRQHKWGLVSDLLIPLHHAHPRSHPTPTTTPPHVYTAIDNSFSSHHCPYPYQATIRFRLQPLAMASRFTLPPPALMSTHLTSSMSTTTTIAPWRELSTSDVCLAHLAYPAYDPCSPTSGAHLVHPWIAHQQIGRSLLLIFHSLAHPAPLSLPH